MLFRSLIVPPLMIEAYEWAVLKFGLTLVGEPLQGTARKAKITSDMLRRVFLIPPEGLLEIVAQMTPSYHRKPLVEQDRHLMTTHVPRGKGDAPIVYYEYRNLVDKVSTVLRLDSVFYALFVSEKSLADCKDGWTIIHTCGKPQCMAPACLKLEPYTKKAKKAAEKQRLLDLKAQELYDEDSDSEPLHEPPVEPLQAEPPVEPLQAEAPVEPWPAEAPIEALPAEAPVEALPVPVELPPLPALPRKTRSSAMLGKPVDKDIDQSQPLVVPSPKRKNVPSTSGASQSIFTTYSRRKVLKTVHCDNFEDNIPETQRESEETVPNSRK